MQNQEYYIDKDGFRIHAKLDFPAEQSEKMPLVILVHGLTGHMEERHIIAISEAIRESGYICLRVELYGHGKTDGAFKNHNVYEWVSEILYVVDYARALPYVSDVYLAGHSQGGLSVILAAGMKQEQIKGLMPLSPAICIVDHCKSGHFFGAGYPSDTIPEELWFWEDKCVSGNYIRVGRTLDVDAAIRAYHGPVLLVHGTLDDAVDLHYSVDADALYENSELCVIEGDGHCYENHLDQVTEAVKNWLLRQN